MGNSHRPSRYRVLLVDDDLAVLDTTAAILSGDADIVTATSAEAGLRAMASERFDVVCTDFKMSGMNGVQLLERVSRLPYAVGCLLITGNAEYLRSVHDSLHYVLIKPYEPDKIIRLVGHLARIARVKNSVSLAGEAGPSSSSPVSDVRNSAPASAPGRLTPVPPSSSVRGHGIPLDNGPASVRARSSRR